MTREPPYILFSNDPENQSLLFSEPSEIVVARTVEEVRPALQRLEELRQTGRWLAGYASYEAGFAFEPKLAPLAPSGRETPLLLFGVFSAPGTATVVPTQTGRNAPTISEPVAKWSQDDYRTRFDRLHRHIREGDCYQANLTMPVDARWEGTPADVFWSLIERQPVRYGTLVEMGGPAIVSRSPELFFKVDGNRWIETHPMKGTAPRGASPADDAAIIAAMKADEKSQAENRMIVDLLRNDISRISEVGTLDVPKLFDIETYPTVHQMVSHVRARLLPEAGLPEIFEALFPCGSITGAPKLSAMTILHALETGPRDIYCGAIGYCDPAGPMRFSVAIRTLALFKDGRAVFNVGGGIVFDSKAEAEYEECLLKARFAVGDQWISR
ncbi:aminodeoxychorismate synthase component I [Ciceribacter sp. L1K22]|uniref:aminodeoxychorismate synthase component I n=1 Tax=Ciceribacter sp. L1K22 TaxID=2820275 RepID=UPI001ABE2C2A|nr:aminodeoxychorismate synthase component I [Ciceribacter sp. L1K22]MBO3761859.1 aminodeoxychorismate synthase component I [Ciceribacter sp. L1K22]